MMYKHAFYGGGSNLSIGKKIRLSLKVARDERLNQFIQDKLKSYSKKKRCNFVSGYEFKRGDLYYAIQHVNISVSGVKNGSGRWIVNIKISDTYDFTELRLMNTIFRKKCNNLFASAANDLGYCMQKMGLIKAYYWNISYYKTYKV